ncbi:DNA-processing protein DprA [Argonema antarcticum]|uniref:DNA-processing protein DprA n=1 Tax=Argonema antarcticum TaxID=2942763 RepID=UPI002013B55E|nr:DNA-processing protein DprA [Argonema antarcticum]MCL1475390.1 DNA-processing protein DprA [Argonema antarcticum A004/B2]
MLEERTFWLVWSQISGVGPILLKRLQQHFGTLAAAWEATPAKLRQVEGFGAKTVEAVVGKRSQIDPEKFLQQHLQKNPDFWTPADAEYPRLMLETPNPPAVMYYRGKVQPQENQGITPTVGIVGTRNPSEYGIRWTRRISAALAKQGFTIVSGMADGIDTEAHRACLEVGGRTLAVFGTGVDVVYPSHNRNLYEQILSNGLVLSEYSAGTPPDRTRFPARNRIIAGLSRAVLVMEAPKKSGALITAQVANDFGRNVYALSARNDDYNFHGCLNLLVQGAKPIPIELDELLKMLGATPIKETENLGSLPLFAQDLPSNQPPLPDLEPELKQVFLVVSSEAMPFDLIIQKAGLAAGSVSSALLQLELMGLVTQLPGMRYQRC